MSSDNMNDYFSVGQNNSFPSIYIAYSSPGFHFPLFFPAFVLAFVSVIGIFFNLSVCYITWKYWGKYTAFKCKTPVLIAINSFLEVVHQSGHFVFLYVTATGRNFIQSSLAFKLEAHSVIITNCVSFMLMTLSIDRVLAVAFPVFSKIT
uniref:G-protein coupled receptors family 1 profile domain-containing protein n=1 Tax=Meloidogyne incognita TaxID=6306 RepID=A0A914MQQ9_MELIC